jgi:serine-type D-Ala-D-Ala carboxypeptidase/endopeptidase (penicillin-binding protein 4)
MRAPRWWTIAAVGLAWAVSVSVAAGPLGPLGEIAARYKTPATAISAIVQAVNKQTPLFAINAEIPRNPASSIKLLTTFVSLDVLGPTYSWPTHVYTLGPIRDGVLEGDLLIKGFGDPFLVEENLWKMLGELRRRGLRRIKGDLVIDDSHFVAVRTDPGAFDGEPYRLYNVLPNALLVNFKAFTFYFSPRVGGVDIRTVPALPNLKITNHLRLLRGRCRGVLATFSMKIPDPIKADEVVFEGGYPASCGEQGLGRTALTHADYAYGLFKTLWAQWGGTLDGGVSRGIAPTIEAPFYVWRSPPLAEVIRPLNKWSNNVMADALLYTLGGTIGKPPLTPAMGAEAVQHYLTAQRISTAGLTLDNGSGLSRITRITATSLNGLLRHAYRSRYMPEFLSSLSIAGVDGTMRRRFRRAGEKGWMHLKTGHLTGVAAVAGYIRARSGVTYSVVLFINGPTAAGNALIDRLLAWTYQQ